MSSFNRDPTGSASGMTLCRVFPVRCVFIQRHARTARSPLGRG